MAQYQINASIRSIRGKQVRRLRTAGYVPAVLYGRETGALALQCDAKELGRLLNTAGTTSLVDIMVDEGEKHTVVVRDVQMDPIRGTVKHVDFYQVVMTETITTEVGITLVGTSTFTGNIFQGVTSLSVECLPQDLISTIEVNISKFTKAGQSITVQELDLPPGVIVLAPPEEVVVHTEALKDLVEAVAAPEPEVEEEEED
jgi:large subunit ribosomal protein L25